MLPYGGQSGNAIIWDYFEHYAQDYFKGFKVMALFGDGGMAVHTRNTPLRTLEDLKGLKQRASSRAAVKTLESLEATPVSMPSAQMTEAIAKGVVDGALATWEVVAPTKLDEVTNYHSLLDEGQPALGYSVLSMLMNKRKYDSLPATLRTSSTAIAEKRCRSVSANWRSQKPRRLRRRAVSWCSTLGDTACRGPGDRAVDQGGERPWTGRSGAGKRLAPSGCTRAMMR